MHDGAGAWIKNAAARAVLSGVGIGSVKDFYDFCVRCLVHNMPHRNFTSQRHFYLVHEESVALYRAIMPADVKGSRTIKCTKTDSTGKCSPS